MAVNIGPKIGIDGEADYRRALQNIIQQTKTLDAEMKALDGTFDKNTSTVEKNAKQHELLQKKQEAAKKRVDELKKGVDESAKKYGENSTQTLKWKEALANAEKELEGINKELKNTAPAEAWKKQLEEASESLKNVGDKIGGAGKSLSMKVTAPIIGVGTAAVKTAADFEASMDNVAALSGATGEELETLAAKAREMGQATKYSASESADAMGYMALAGWDAGEMLDGIEPILKLAGAANMDLATASDIVTDALTAFGMGAEDTQHMVDVLATTMSKSNTNVEQLGEAFKYAAPMAGTLGYSVDDVGLALGLMANAGIKASQGGTALRRLMINMSKPTDTVANAMNALGVYMFDAEGNARPLRDLMEDLRASLQDGGGDIAAFQNGIADLSAQMEAGEIDEAEYNEAILALAQSTGVVTDQFKANALASLAGATGMSGLAAIVGASAEDWNKLSTAIDGSEGAANDMYATMQDNLNGQLTILKSNLSEAAISIGNALIPMISSLADKIDGAVTWFNKLNSSQKQTIIKIAGVAAAIGPVLVVLGTIISSVGTIVGAVSAAMPIITGVAGAVAAAIGAISAPVLAVVAAIGVAIAAGVAIVKNWETIKQKAAELGEKIKNIWSNFKIPHIPMPHFSLEGSFSLSPPSVPHLKVDWYAKAMQNGMILNGPTIFGQQGNTLLGGGEAGAEVVVGASSLMGMIQNAVGNAVGGTSLGGVTMNIYGAAGQDVEELADIIGEKLQQLTERRGAVWA